VCALASHLEGNIIGGGVLEFESYSTRRVSIVLFKYIRGYVVPGAVEQCYIAREPKNDAKKSIKHLPAADKW
jgi:hypothetical protein